MSWTEFVYFFVYLWKVLNLLEPFGKGRNFNLTEVKLDEKCNFDFCRKNYGSDTDTEIQPRFSVAHYKKCCQILEIIFVLKFGISKRATTFETISHMIDVYLGNVKSSGRLFKILWPFQNVQTLFHYRIIQNLTKPIVAFLLSYAHTRNKF